MKQIGFGFLALVLACLSGCSAGSSDSSWARLLGSPAEEGARSVALAKDGTIVIAGSSQGAVDSTPNRGGNDIFVAKYDTEGNLKWKQTFGTPQNEEARAITVDAEGNVFVTGYTSGNLDGSNAGNDDQVFVLALESDGKTKWTKLYGETTAVAINSVKESGEGIALTTDGGIVVVGYTVNSFGKAVGENIERDAFLLKLDKEGAVIDSKRYESGRNDGATSVTVAADGAIFIAGSTEGSLGGDQGQVNSKEGASEAFVARIGTTPEDTWIRLLGTTAHETGEAVAADPTSGAVYLGGSATSGLTGQQGLGMGDGYVAKFDAAGKLLWQQLVGSDNIDIIQGLAVGSQGQLFATGVTWNQGGTDVYVSQLSPDNGTRTGHLQRSGSTASAWGFGIVSDGQGRLVVAGWAGGDVDKEKGAGGLDALLWKLNEKDLAPKR